MLALSSASERQRQWWEESKCLIERLAEIVFLLPGVGMGSFIYTNSPVSSCHTSEEYPQSHRVLRQGEGVACCSAFRMTFPFPDHPADLRNAFSFLLEAAWGVFAILCPGGRKWLPLPSLKGN